MDPVDLLKMPSPTPEMVHDRLFDAIFDAIRSWDVNVPACYAGYCGANGSHAAMIYASIKRAMGEPVNFGASEIVEAQARYRGWPSTVQPVADALQFAKNWVEAAAQYGRDASYWRDRALMAEAKLLGAQ